MFMSIIISLSAGGLIILIAAALAYMVWRIVSVKRFPLFILLFLVLPAGLLIRLGSFGSETGGIFWVSQAFLGMMAAMLLLVYATSQEKKIAAEEELRETRHRIALEKAHYEFALARRDELAEIRSEWLDKLESVVSASTCAGDDGARELIVGLASSLNSTNENPYCGIPVVNAVLTEKDKACTLAGIELKVSLSLPDTLAVSPMHLCSIFSNIIDNAIAGCKKTQEKNNLAIRLSSMTDGDYLFLKAVNPSDAPKNKPSPGRGYGFKILSELSEMYGGGFQTYYRNGEFSAVVSILAQEADPVT